MDAVLDALQALGDRAQAPRQAFDVGGGGQVQGPHRDLLGLGGLLAGVGGATQRAAQQGVVEQVGQRLAEPVLSAAGQAVAQAFG